MNWIAVVYAVFSVICKIVAETVVVLAALKILIGEDGGKQ